MNKYEYIKSLVAIGQYQCSRCGEIKSLDDFPKNRHANHGIKSHCKDCKHKEDALYRETCRKNGKRRKGGTFRKRRVRHTNEHGETVHVAYMTLEEAVALYGNNCNICGANDKKLHIDHCHQTGSIRGLLCHSCNVGIGFLRDDVAVLQGAIEYLQNAPIRATKVA